MGKKKLFFFFTRKEILQDYVCVSKTIHVAQCYLKIVSIYFNMYFIKAWYHWVIMCDFYDTI